ncbi:type II toxin-antitoxin system Phd/YefM family antitoxin [Chlorogloeopsis sp. ULAP01]|uniref:type II toxin-antitoxin system Phd/YefM family antitoxin n=1 Tax=Chlorogloeopsis sp. ULAP01 TaxID=3056483 RepID=UPI0025AA98CF|nr:type II toxin-antitoxin system Phd/YefM family antitoxin [Chlorogloeopsis sp. ULAP01]MDM9385217.1 type II toxin-antitoxin system Phd/YefM family antitoxin [Chlorogloeopsis sp. ULAP01]
MPKYLTITEARQHLLNLPDELKDEPVIITKHGKPVMAALSFEQYESLLETLSILGDRSFKVTVGAKGTWNSTENL